MKLLGRLIRAFFPRRPSEIEKVTPEEISDLAVHVQRCTARNVVLFDQVYSLRWAVSFLIILYVITADWKGATLPNSLIAAVKALV